MGTWGTGLYCDDTTCDVRDDYIQNLKYGLSSDEAYQKILIRHGDLLAQTEIACLVYFALADTAWRYGRLDEFLKDKALALLESGGDLFVWERDAPRDVASRRRTLQALLARLKTTLPAEKPVKTSSPKPKKVRTTAPTGSVFSLALPSNHTALLVLVGSVELEKSIDPVFSVLALRIASPEELPSQITEDHETLVFSQLLRQPFLHVAILPKDERQGILTGLAPVNVPVVSSMPFQRESIVWMAVGRIAKEIETHLNAISVSAGPNC